VSSGTPATSDDHMTPLGIAPPRAGRVQPAIRRWVLAGRLEVPQVSGDRGFECEGQAGYLFDAAPPHII
jgi:hypothetical protein